MDDTDNLKQEQQQSVTVNYENLHANMALENPDATEIQTEQKSVDINESSVECNEGSENELEQTSDGQTEFSQSELKSDDVSLESADEDAAESDARDSEENKMEDDHAEVKIPDTPQESEESTVEPGNSGTSHEEHSGEGDEDESNLQEEEPAAQADLEVEEKSEVDEGNTAVSDNDDITEPEEGKDDVISVQQRSEGSLLQNDEGGDQNGAGNTENGDQTGEPENVGGSAPSSGEEDTVKVDNESGEVEEIARGIIKSVVDGATEQIALEKSSNEVGETDSSQEKEATLGEKEPEWLDLLGNGLLRKKILKPGNGEDSRPLRENEVSIRYEARLLPSGDEIVESDDNLTFVLGEQDVIAAFDLALALMQKGEVAIVETDAKYAYEDKGKPPKIPPNTGLVFEIELLEVRPGPFSSDINLDRRLMWADLKRQKGNEFYSDKKYIQASMAYGRATKALEKGWMNEEMEEGRVRINNLRIKCYNNLSASKMKEEKWKEAMQSCRAAELLEPNNVKTLFRKGKIHCELGELDKGVAVLSKAEKIDPDNKTIAAEAAKQKRRLEKQDESRKNMYRRMLGTKPGETNPSSKDLKQESGWFRNWGRVVGGTIAIGAVLIGVYIAQRT